MEKIAANSNTLCGIKSLRKLDDQNKPLHVSLFSAVRDLIAFMSRMMSCDAPVHVAPIPGQAKAARMVMNEVGRWVPAKD